MVLGVIISVPRAEKLFLLVLSILALESAHSIRFFYRHFLSGITKKSLNAFYYACSYAKVDCSGFMNVTAKIDLHLIESPVLGPISPKELSGGVKTVLLMLFDETGKIFNASACGDNCAKGILKIAESKDLTINLRHIMEFGDDEFEMKILNTGEVVHNMLEFVNVVGLYV